MQALMMNTPLLISGLLRHAARYHSDTEIVSRTLEGPIRRYTYADAWKRAARVANALARLGLQRGDRVGTLAWNGYRHFELYYGVSGAGHVMNTVNPRLFPEQVAWIINHAENQYLFFDLTFAPLIDAIAAQCPTVMGWVALCDRDHLPTMQHVVPLCYEDLLLPESEKFDWPLLDENAGATLCYTSGTTGNPKGVLYSHRSTVLHAMTAVMPDVMNLSSHDAVLPVVPMFHANAWGIPYSAPLVGAKLVFPGAALDGASLMELFENEGVTFAAGVPTVWLGLLQHLQKTGQKPTTLRRCVIGGAACPPALMDAFQHDYEVQIDHAWGMTELSPLGTYGRLKRKHADLPPDQQRALKLKQGRPVYGVEVRIVDGDGGELCHDGVAFGDLHVRGPWVAESYFKYDQSPIVDGWFPTGDVATIDPDGYVQITDRSKDVIKSGGEWISSIELENLAMSHPAVAEAAVIAACHPKWDERPLLVVVRKTDAEVTREALIRHYEGKIAKWWIPDDVVFVDTLPHTATGKINKLKLREQFASYRFPVQAA
jgi:acyl-CoA synthetase (AMP-forming)/AMP-acid ligase II